MAHVDGVTKARRVLDDKVVVAGSGGGASKEIAWQLLAVELEV